MNEDVRTLRKPNRTKEYIKRDSSRHFDKNFKNLQTHT